MGKRAERGLGSIFAIVLIVFGMNLVSDKTQRIRTFLTFSQMLKQSPPASTMLGAPLPTLPENFNISESATRTTKENETVLTHHLRDRYEILHDVEVWLPVLYEAEDFSQIEAITRQYLAHDRPDELASSYLSRLYLELGELRIIDDSSIVQQQQLQQQLAVLERWQAAYPDSHIPRLVHGILRTQYAQVVGNGHPRNLEGDRRAKYLQEIAVAIEELESAAKLEPSDPNVWSQLMHTSLGARDFGQISAYYREGLRANPFHALLHREWLNVLAMDWHGSMEEQIAFGRKIGKIAEKRERPLLASVALQAYRTVNRRNTGFVEQPEIQAEVAAIYEQIFERYPNHPRMRFFYAYDAVQMKQYDVALEQFEWLGDRWTTGVRWRDLEHFHDVRAQVYLRAAHNAFLRRDAEATKKLASFSNELQPSAGVFLLLAALSGNTDPDITKANAYVEQALALNPTELEKQEAQRIIQQLEAMIGKR